MVTNSHDDIFKVYMRTRSIKVKLRTIKAEQNKLPGFLTWSLDIVQECTVRSLQFTAEYTGEFKNRCVTTLLLGYVTYQNQRPLLLPQCNI